VAYGEFISTLLTKATSLREEIFLKLQPPFPCHLNRDKRMKDFLLT